MKNIDVARMAGLMTREVKRTEKDGHPAAAVIASRVYDTDAADLWDAVTVPERLARWFLPVEGELRVGGKYQLKGNAGGTITACTPPKDFAATWEFGGFVSWIEVAIEPAGKGARLTLTHTGQTDNPFFEQFGPGATGVGWDLGLLGLALHFEGGGEALDPKSFEAWTVGDEGKQFLALTSGGWGAADEASGRDATAARDSAAATLKFYSGG